MMTQETGQITRSGEQSPHQNHTRRVLGNMDNEITLRRYKDFRPTQFDGRGLALPDQQAWYVAPVAKNRDSGALARANFDATLKALGGESETVEVHRFGHWANGWFEIIIINPSQEPTVKLAQEISDSLEDYPIVCEELFSQYEDEECSQTWEHCYSPSERITYFRNHSHTVTSMADLFAAIRGSWHHAANMLHCPSELAHN